MERVRVRAADIYGCGTLPELKIGEARDRVGDVLSRQDRVAVAWSGGKDSTALLELAVELAADVPGALPVHAVWLDSGAEYRATVEMARRLRKRRDVVLHWYQVPVVIAESDIPGLVPPFYAWELLPRTRHWEPGADRDLELGDGQYFNSMDKTELPVFGRAARKALGGAPVGVLDALQAADGPVQAHSLREGRGDAAHGLRWAWDEEEGGVRYAPLWDWTGPEVWELIRQRGWDYNGVYDRMAELGVPAERARIGTLYRHGITRMGLLGNVDPLMFEAMARQAPGLLSLPRRERYGAGAEVDGGDLSEEG